MPLIRRAGWRGDNVFNMCGGIVPWYTGTVGNQIVIENRLDWDIIEMVVHMVIILQS